MQNIEKFELNVENQKVKGEIHSVMSDSLMILVHGFTGSMYGPENGIFDLVTERLLEENFDVLTFSFRGSPPSEGEFIDMTLETEVTDFEHIINFAESKNYNSIGVIGESMGGTVITEGYSEKFSHMIFWYPAFDFSETDLKNYLEPEIQTKVEKEGFVMNDGFKVGENFIDQIPEVDVYEKLKNISSPTLLIHGSEDKEVPYQQSEKAFSLIPYNKKELEIVEGPDHCFFGYEDKLIDLTIGFLKNLKN